MYEDAIHSLQTDSEHLQAEITKLRKTIANMGKESRALNLRRTESQQRVIQASLDEDKLTATIEKSAGAEV
jgi:regulator of replication initiation timing